MERPQTMAGATNVETGVVSDEEQRTTTMQEHGHKSETQATQSFQTQPEETASKHQRRAELKQHLAKFKKRQLRAETSTAELEGKDEGKSRFEGARDFNNTDLERRQLETQTSGTDSLRLNTVLSTQVMRQPPD